MKKRIFLFLFCSFNLGAFAQTFTLSNLENGKEKTFRPGGFYEIMLAENVEAFKENCCDYTTLQGSLTSVSADSFNLNLKSYYRRVIMDNQEIKHEYYSKEASNYGGFSKNDIYSFKYFKSGKSRKRKEVFTALGAVFISTGIVTALNTFVVSDSDNRKAILLSGGVQAGLGIVFLITSSSKNYRLKGDDISWKLK